MTSRSKCGRVQNIFSSSFFRRFICMGVIEQAGDEIDTTFLFCLVSNAISFKYKHNWNHHLLLSMRHESFVGATRHSEFCSLKFLHFKTNHANPRISNNNRFDAMAFWKLTSESDRICKIVPTPKQLPWVQRMIALFSLRIRKSSLHFKMWTLNDRMQIIIIFTYPTRNTILFKSKQG